MLPQSTHSSKKFISAVWLLMSTFLSVSINFDETIQTRSIWTADGLYCHTFSVVPTKCRESDKQLLELESAAWWTHHLAQAQHISVCRGLNWYSESQLQLIKWPVGTRGSFAESKATGTWIWPFTSIKCRCQECVELYFHSPIHLHDLVLN